MKKISAILAFIMCTLCAFADEGMWLTDILGKKAQEWCHSVVSYDFMGTGTLVSENGLVVTNHHVVYGDVHDLSTKDNDLLENGFWAYGQEDELPIPGRSIQIRCATIDVTEEVKALIAEGAVKEGPMMLRRLGSIMENRYEKSSGKMAILSSMWRGSRYQIDLYDNYKDIRLVAAPPVAIGAYGGDEDNWEWPQHKGDFAFVRIYAAADGSAAEYSPDNVPLKTPFLKISTKGVKEGDRTLILGYPGRTSRYSSAAQVRHSCEVVLPVTVEVGAERMEIMKRWMNADEQIRLKYSDAFFNLSNVQELYMGTVDCCRRFDVVKHKEEDDKDLFEWIDARPQRRARYGAIKDSLALYYSAGELDRQMAYLRECLLRSTRLSAFASRLESSRRPHKGGHRATKDADKIANLKRSAAKDFGMMDLRLEKDMFFSMLRIYINNVQDDCLGPYQLKLKQMFEADASKMAEYLWNASWMTKQSEIEHFIDSETDLMPIMDVLCNDPLVRFFNDNKIVKFNALKQELLGRDKLYHYQNLYVQARYEKIMQDGGRQYPDANSTMRASFGKVCSLQPRDAVSCSYKSTVAGLLEKDNPRDHDFRLPEDWKQVLQKAPANMMVNFMTDNDITGGNSGSAVLDSRGGIVGLAFDGNKESLAGDFAYVSEYNRTISVDIRYVLWILENYARFDRLLNELKQ